MSREKGTCKLRDDVVRKLATSWGSVVTLLGALEFCYKRYAKYAPTA